MLMSSEKLGLTAGSLQQRRMRDATAGSTVDGMSSCRLPQPTAPTTCTHCWCCDARRPVVQAGGVAKTELTDTARVIASNARLQPHHSQQMRARVLGFVSMPASASCPTTAPTLWRAPTCSTSRTSSRARTARTHGHSSNTSTRVLVDATHAEAVARQDIHGTDVHDDAE